MLLDTWSDSPGWLQMMSKAWWHLRLEMRKSPVLSRTALHGQWIAQESKLALIRSSSYVRRMEFASLPTTLITTAPFLSTRSLADPSGTTASGKEGNLPSVLPLIWTASRPKYNFYADEQAHGATAVDKPMLETFLTSDKICFTYPGEAEYLGPRRQVNPYYLTRLLRPGLRPRSHFSGQREWMPRKEPLVPNFDKLLSATTIDV
ncbi:uncharacterized protein LY79DRAFT_576827 [Colletotrichum navitas]|uniref:Uncharacterized protein n=1 Tax=Colletotrichum navitas TaxID=681940 RepID=A0AAD8Q7D2_9PEZI|nr:uncharacterized protein LY79DRAFT_576827 [Colletotrichum navitas]KAK1597070.1 hypothetical protein LY79DRAFT_576827 [Colletotrichum navitas]